MSGSGLIVLSTDGDEVVVGPPLQGTGSDGGDGVSWLSLRRFCGRS